MTHIHQFHVYFFILRDSKQADVSSHGKILLSPIDTRDGATTYFVMNVWLE